MEIHIIGPNGKEIIWLSKMLSIPRQGRIVSYQWLLYEWIENHKKWERIPDYWREIDNHPVPFYGAIIFKTSQDIKDYFDERLSHQNWKENLGNKNIEAIDYYTGNDFKHLNKHLRICHKNKIPFEKSWGISSKEINHVKNLDKAIRDYTLEEPIRVYRGVRQNLRKKLLSKLRNKENFHDGAFTSSSCYKYSRIVHRPGTDLIVIDVPKGRGYGAYINEYSQYNQYEYLLGRNTELKITECKIIGGRYVFFAEAVLNE